MQDIINEILNYTKEKLETINSSAECQNLRVEILGKSGKITALFRFMKEVPNEEKGKVGAMLNNAKNEAEKLISAKEVFLEQAELQKEINSSEKIDITLPCEHKVGSLHPRTIIQKQIEDVFVSMGFVVEDGNEVETEYNNFTAVNVPANHPARDMQDTFFITDNILLRSQTSNMQVRCMETMKPPFKIVCPGRVYRNDSDSSHSPIFNQFEALVVDENIGLKDLMLMIKEILKRLFGEDVKMRVRPSYFPFTEPSIEIDATCQMCQGKGCSLCKGSGFSEVFGAGVVNPKVLEMSGIDSTKYSGFAFGPGIDRSVMVTNKIPNIKYLFRNDLRFLKQMR